MTVRPRTRRPPVGGNTAGSYGGRWPGGVPGVGPVRGRRLTLSLVTPVVAAGPHGGNDGTLTTLIHTQREREREREREWG